MRPSTSEINLLRSKPHSTTLWLSIYQPETMFAAQLTGTATVNTVDYYNLTEGSTELIQSGMVMLVGTTLGGNEKGRLRVRSVAGNTLTVAENSHINWEADDYLTVQNFVEITAIYPRILQADADGNTIWYKDYDITYTNQNNLLGSFINMGCHYAGFTEDAIYYSASGTVNLMEEALTYEWWFQGGVPTGSSAHTPGNIVYPTPGHYTTRLIVTTTGSAVVNNSYRHVSIYDRPEQGTNTPILKWEISDFSGSRSKGGYTAKIRLRETATVLPGYLVVIFADDQYGGVQQSVGGNALNRSSIVFAGYILDGTIEYNYRDSFVDFEIGSPSEIMMRAEGFSFSVDSSIDPSAQADTDPDFPTAWALLVNMDARRAIFHYLRWHSTVLLCTDFEFLGTDKATQHFDSDRTSLYDAINTQMRGALVGKLVSDRQGKLWAETDIYTEQSTYPDGLSIQKTDWVGDPSIEQQQSDPVSFIEMGGVAYSGPATGTFSALLASAPGSAPGYRGNLQRIQGLTLEGQTQLNQLVGDTYAYENAEYPFLSLNIAGNYRNFDIAPQEKTIVTVATDDTVRGISLTENFLVESIGWNYDAEVGYLNPFISLHQIPVGVAGVTGETIIIPDIPPTGGFDLPDIDIPPFPTIPPFPVDFLNTLRYQWIQPQYGYDGWYGNYLQLIPSHTGVGGNGPVGYRTTNFAGDNPGVKIEATAILMQDGPYVIYPMWINRSTTSGKFAFIGGGTGLAKCGEFYGDPPTGADTPEVSVPVIPASAAFKDAFFCSPPIVETEGGIGFMLFIQAHRDATTGAPFDTAGDLYFIGWILEYVS